MKKKYLLFLILWLTGLETASAQFTDLHNFNDTSGSGPSSPLVISGKTMFGATSGGGLYANGIIYSIDTNGNNFKVLYTFDSTFSYSVNSGPVCGLTLVGNKLYGTTYQLGSLGNGNIFSIDTDGTNYKDLLDFNITNGQMPNGYLVYSFGKLYGMTFQGGAHNGGLVFSIDTNGNNYKDLLDFGGANGLSPQGSLTIYNNKLYGPTQDGGAYGYGTLFSLDTDGTGYKKLHDFNDTTGANPAGGLVALNNKLYGIAEWKDIFYAGYIFAIDTDGSNYKNIHRLNDTDADMNGSLIYNNGTLYGMATAGGIYSSGELISLDTTGSSFKEFFTFNDTDGFNLENGKLTFYNNTLYGVAYQGGPYQYYGLVFKFRNSEVSTSVKELKPTAGAISVYPNPGNGVFTASISGSNTQEEITNVEVYNILGEKVYANQTVIHTSQFLINLSSQPGGVYLYRIIAQNGDLLGEGKLIIRK